MLNQDALEAIALRMGVRMAESFLNDPYNIVRVHDRLEPHMDALDEASQRYVFERPDQLEDIAGELRFQVVEQWGKLQTYTAQVKNGVEDYDVLFGAVESSVAVGLLLQAHVRYRSDAACMLLGLPEGVL